MSSIPLTSATVQAAKDAKARLAMTALTKTSADRNVPQGDRSTGASVAAIGASGVPCASATV
jgi:hypothetical protein